MSDAPLSSCVAEVIDLDAEVTPADFDPSISEDERRFYTKAYPSLQLVCDRKVHCTICKMHIGTAPAQESLIKMHPVLRVTHCTKCHDFYNSGEFSKGEDGSELYCRWCGQGGEVYCCSNCPYVFCKSCIVKNLSRGVVADIEQNENWSCFNCAPKILWPLRAQHWALVKYIDKQKKKLSSMGLSEAELKHEMMKDRSACCRLAKSKSNNLSDSAESVDSISRRSLSAASSSSTGKKAHKIVSRSESPAAKRSKQSNDEVVCTPDLLSMLEPDCQITVSPKPPPSHAPMASSPKVMSIHSPGVYSGNNPMQTSTPKNTPPPLVLRNTSVQMRQNAASSPVVRRTVVGSRSSGSGSAAPVYHTINGYRIDLNTAAQQETFRLPNGKLIQVKRQGSSNNTSPSPVQPVPTPPQPHNSWQRNVHVQHPTRPVHITPAPGLQPYSQINVQPPQHPQMLQYQNAAMSNTTVTSLQNGSPAPIHFINGGLGATAQQLPPQPSPQLGAVRPLMVRVAYPDTAFGHSRTQLQDQVFNTMEICLHLTSKVQTLTNSNAYKQARNYMDVKELYIHLSYLLTYAIGRFKGLQDKCLVDMRQLGFSNDADSLENGQLAADKQASDDEDNDIEIVEPKTDTITLDSDNEDDCYSSSVSNNNSVVHKPSQLSLALTASTAKKVNTQQSAPLDRSAQEAEFLSNAQSFLASMLEIDMSEGDQNSAQASPSGGTSSSASGNDAAQKKQPRKKTTNKPNPTLLKKQEILQRERLEEMKRNDMKLKMKCTIELKKAEEEYPFAKEMLDEEAAEQDLKSSDESNKKEDDVDEVEVLMVEEVSSDSSLEEDKPKTYAKSNQKKEQGDNKSVSNTSSMLNVKKAEAINRKVELGLEKKDNEGGNKNVEAVEVEIEVALTAEHKKSQLTKESSNMQDKSKATAEASKTAENNQTQVEDFNKSGSSTDIVIIEMIEKEDDEEEEHAEEKRKDELISNELIPVNRISAIRSEGSEKLKIKSRSERSSPTPNRKIRTECGKSVYVTVESSSTSDEFIPNSEPDIDVDKEIAKLLNSKNSEGDVNETAAVI